MLYNVAVVAVGAALWIGSCHVEWPNQLALIWIALWVDICGQTLYVTAMVVASWMGQKWYDKINNLFEFCPGESHLSLSAGKD